MSNFEWRDCFPKGFQPRKIQQDAIQFALDGFFNKNKRFVILQLPTGSGKSFIATTISEYFNKINSNNKSYMICPQIILQRQYQKQFPMYSNISSRNNYFCQIFKDTNCGEMKWLHMLNNVPKCQFCLYQKQKKNFVDNKVSITNTAFFLSNLLYNQDLIKKRSLLVVDECHNLEQDIIRMNGVSIEFNILNSNYAFKQQNWLKYKEEPLTWIINKLLPFLDAKCAQLASSLQNNGRGIQLTKQKIIQISRRHDFVDKLFKQLDRILQNFDPDRWVIQNDTDNKKITISPIFASDFAQDAIFNRGQKVLLMSGTILNKKAFCQNLGIQTSDCLFLSLDSTFPIQNRKIFILGSGSMSKNNINATLPKAVQDIKKILQLHQQDRGIIHVSSHHMATQIFQRVKSNRLIIIDQFQSRDQMLDYHGQSKNTVLISPSMMQGVDLKQDLSRFQIIGKVPYPNLGSKYISTKKQLIKSWYQFQTVKSIVQAYGRSVRSSQDYAVTYIIDSDILNLLKYNRNMIPKYFMQAISFGKL